ncbi:MucR family transcriptional regulator [Segeticoccus rhizosphaerae]|uniref:MucR family transcriptional regulator n=1 Tax=Segeticoccus rhizosphaerae TaxID=1104777 RepID=UPI0012649447
MKGLTELAHAALAMGIAVCLGRDARPALDTPSCQMGATQRDAVSSWPSAAPVASGVVRVGEPDGQGRFGVLEVAPDGLLVCHECGQAHRHLGLHVARAHGVQAAEYRRRHGLARTRGLVAEDLRALIAGKARERMDRPEGAGFVAARDSARASLARLAAGEGWAPEVLAAHIERTSTRARTRTRIVVRCGECGVRFSPIRGNLKRRKFCSRTCANIANRRARRRA